MIPSQCVESVYSYLCVALTGVEVGVGVGESEGQRLAVESGQMGQGSRWQVVLDLTLAQARGEDVMTGRLCPHRATGGAESPRALAGLLRTLTRTFAPGLFPRAAVSVPVESVASLGTRALVPLLARLRLTIRVLHLLILPLCVSFPLSPFSETPSVVRGLVSPAADLRLGPLAGALPGAGPGRGALFLGVFGRGGPRRGLVVEGQQGRVAAVAEHQHGVGASAEFLAEGVSLGDVVEGAQGGVVRGDAGGQAGQGIRAQETLLLLPVEVLQLLVSQQLSGHLQPSQVLLPQHLLLPGKHLSLGRLEEAIAWRRQQHTVS